MSWDCGRNGNGIRVSYWCRTGRAARSGAHPQRVAIARALANKPALLLADEPTGNLDSKTAVEVIGLLKASSQKYHQTVLMVTHNEALAQTCDRIIRIEDGRLYQREDAFYGEGGEL